MTEGAEVRGLRREAMVDLLTRIADLTDEERRLYLDTVAEMGDADVVTEVSRAQPVAHPALVRAGLVEVYDDPSGPRVSLAHAHLFEPPPESRPRSRAYALASGHGPRERIKIGFSASVRDRVWKLQVGNPDRIRIVATIPGGAPLEGILKDRFWPLRTSGEWHRHGPELDAWLREVTL